jgi:hypothetical protein
MYQTYGLGLPPLTLPQWVAIIVATLILAGKMTLKGLMGKEFKLHEQGPEASLLTLGAAVPSAADSIVRTKHEPVLWSIFAVVSIVLLFVTVLSSEAAEQSMTGSTSRSVWSALSMVLGAGSFLFYIFLVVMKTGV